MSRPRPGGCRRRPRRRGRARCPRRSQARARCPSSRAACRTAGSIALGLGWQQSAAGVGDLEAPARRRRGPTRSRSACRRRVVVGVLEQVDERLREPLRVGAQRARRRRSARPRAARRAAATPSTRRRRAGGRSRRRRGAATRGPPCRRAAHVVDDARHAVAARRGRSRSSRRAPRARGVGGSTSRWPRQIVIGVRSSCEVSRMNVRSRRNDASSRASMRLSVVARLADGVALVVVGDPLASGRRCSAIASAASPICAIQSRSWSVRSHSR